MIGADPCSNAAAAVLNASTSLPTAASAHGTLFALNLFLMTSFMCLGALMAGRMACALWSRRALDQIFHPISVWRLGWLLAASALCLRCGSEAMNLWAWNPNDMRAATQVLVAKRWIDPLTLMLAGGWLVLVILSDAGMTEQLGKRPYPVPMLVSLPSLKRPGAILVLSLIAVVGVAVTR